MRWVDFDLNMPEFYYKTCQTFGKQTGEAWYFQLRNSELRIVYREEFVRAAGFEKCRQSPNLSLADCFALALAKAENALLITTDAEPAKVRDVRTRRVEI